MLDNFTIQPNLKSESISLRPLHESDFSGLYKCAADRKLWEGHPSKDRYQESEFKTWFNSAIDSNAALVILDTLTDNIIGSSRFYVEDSEPSDISVGFTFIARQYWGGNTNYELKKLMLAYAFRYFDSVWFHIDPSNIRSQKATQKIGGVFCREAISNISGEPLPYVFYKIEKKSWFQ